MTALVSALTIGLILSLLALGVFISFRVFAFPDITVDGSITLGACVSSVLLVTEPTPLRQALPWAVAAGLAAAAGLFWLLLAEGKKLRTLLTGAAAAAVIVAGFVVLVLRFRNPVVATIAGGAGGLLAGMTTGLLHAKFKIHGLLSGILVMTALYSVNLHVLGKSNVSLQSATTLSTYADDLGNRLLGGRTTLHLFGWEVAAHELSMLGFAFVFISLCGAALFAFFRTDLGTAMRATGDSPQMIRALGTNVGNMMVLGLALSNGLVALSGSLFAQYQGFADVQMGIGMVVLGLASVIIGEALVGPGHLGLTLAGTVMGSILFRLLVAIALRAGLDPVDLKLITAVSVFLALVFPRGLALVKGWTHRAAPKEGRHA
jgi:putative tryptophan/tyrosine transport system permease protein